MNDGFVKLTFLVIIIGLAAAGLNCTKKGNNIPAPSSGRVYNGSYAGPYLNRLAFPIGGIGAGMICLEGTSAVFPRMSL